MAMGIPIVISNLMTTQEFAPAGSEDHVELPMVISEAQGTIRPGSTILAHTLRTVVVLVVEHVRLTEAVVLEAHVVEAPLVVEAVGVLAGIDRNPPFRR